MASPIRDKQANRRIRLLLAVFTLVFAAMFARAVLAPGRAGRAPVGARAEPARGRRRRSRPAAARSSTAPASSSRSASRRRRSTPTRSRCATRVRSRSRRTRCSASTRTSLYPELREQEEPVRLRRSASSIPAKAALVPEEGLRRRRAPTPRSSAPTRRTASAPRCSATRASTTRARRARAAVRPQARRAARHADDRPRPDGPRDRHDQLAAGAGGRGRLHDARPHDPGAGREGAARDGRAVGREGRDGDRARPVDGRGARDGADARLRREQHVERRALRAGLLRNRAVTDTYEPGSTFKLVTITGALSDGIVTPSTRFTLPYLFRYGGCYQCTVHDAESRGTVNYSVAQILAVLVERRRRHDRREARRVAARLLGEEVRVRLARPASTSRARARASSCRSTSGATRRSATCRSGRGSR